MLDLAHIDTPKASEAGFEIELEYNGKPSGSFVTVIGEHAKAVRTYQLKVGNKFRLKEWQASRKGVAGGQNQMTEEDMEIGLRGAAVRVSAFRDIKFGGETWECTPENAYELVRRHPPFADQILAASGDVENFTQKPVQS